MIDNGISSFELSSSNYQSMLTIPDFLLTQTVIQETYQKAEKDLGELLKKKGIINNNPNINIERERKQNTAEQSKLRTQIQQLEQKPTKTPQQEQDLAAKKQKLKELEEKEKELKKPLSEESLETKIAKLEKEIAELEKKSNKTKEEERVLGEKKQELEKLQQELAEQNKSNASENKKDNSDKIALYIGLGIVGVVLIGLGIVLFRRGKKKRKKY